MTVASALAIYFVVWWVVLFAVLPWGVRSQEESGTVSEGTDPGAPVVPRLWAKLMWTTIVSLVVFALAAQFYFNKWVTIEGLVALIGM